MEEIPQRSLVMSQMGQGRLSSRVDDTAGLPSAPELPCAPSQLRLVP